MGEFLMNPRASIRWAYRMAAASPWPSSSSNTSGIKSDCSEEYEPSQAIATPDDLSGLDIVERFGQAAQIRRKLDKILSPDQLAVVIMKNLVVMSEKDYMDKRLALSRCVVMVSRFHPNLKGKYIMEAIIAWAGGEKPKHKEYEVHDSTENRWRNKVADTLNDAMRKAERTYENDARAKRECVIISRERF